MKLTDPAECFRGAHNGALYCVPTVISRITGNPYPDAVKALNRTSYDVLGRHRRAKKGYNVFEYAPLLYKAGYETPYDWSMLPSRKRPTLSEVARRFIPRGGSCCPYPRPPPDGVERKNLRQSTNWWTTGAP